MPKIERIFSISNNSKGLWCPFKAVFCQEGYCQGCQVYLDYQGHQNHLAEMGGRPLAWCSAMMIEERLKAFLEVMKDFERSDNGWTQAYTN